MMLRTTAQLEEDLNQAHWRLDHARNSLAELDAEVSKLKAILIEVAIEKRAESANLLPDCPRCGGDWVNYHDPADPPNAEGMVCPDCDHGKVSIPQLVEYWMEFHQ